MLVKKGRDRVVIVFPALGLVFKLPRIRILRAFQLTRMLLNREHRHRLWSNLQLEWQLPVEHTMSGVKGLLCRGVVANWREFRFYQTTRHPLLQPTLCSLFGFCNVQKYCAPYTRAYRALWTQMLTLTNGSAWDDTHHFSNPDNFGVREGRLRMLDYGNPKGWPVVLAYGSTILNEFDPESGPVSVPREHL